MITGATAPTTTSEIGNYTNANSGTDSTITGTIASTAVNTAATTV